MRIIERYGTGIRIFTGRGAWSLLTPARCLLSVAYRAWLDLRGGAPRAAGAESGTRVVSIGNLEMGGGGKTPCVILLAEEIIRRGGRPAVVTRGYRSAAERAGMPVVLPGGISFDTTSTGGYILGDRFLERVRCRGGRAVNAAESFGDEVVLYQKRGIPVVIDPNRRRGVETAAGLFSPTVLLLDDAFQNRSVHRDVDILLLDAERPLADGRLLPLGRLRERPEAIQRAHAVVFTRARREHTPAHLQGLVSGKLIFFARHSPIDLLFGDGKVEPLSELRGRAIALFSGIARPDSFEELAVESGAEPVVSFRFADHHRYTAHDVRAMLAEVPDGALFLTTEKDLAKAELLFPEGTAVASLRIAMEIDGIDGLVGLAMGSADGEAPERA